MSQSPTKNLAVTSPILNSCFATPSSVWQLSTSRPVERHWTSDSPPTSDKPQRRKQWSPGRARRYTGTAAQRVAPTTSLCCVFFFYSSALSPCFCSCAWWWSGAGIFFFTRTFLFLLTFVVVVFAAAVAHGWRVPTHVLCFTFDTCAHNDFLLSSSLRRIDVSPRAFKKHAQLFEAVKNSEDGTYKVTEYFGEWSMLERTNSEWVSQCLLDCPLLTRVGVPRREKRDAQSLSNASAK